jgi:hypothetical protein
MRAYVCHGGRAVNRASSAECMNLFVSSDFTFHHITSHRADLSLLSVSSLLLCDALSTLPKWPAS